MTDVFEIDPAAPDPSAIDAAILALRSGRLVVLPTETVYGLAVRPDDRAATNRVFSAKGRPRSLNLPVLAPDSLTAWRVGRPNAAATALAGAFWPGPLTLVVPRAAGSGGWSLGDRADTVGVRVPGHSLSLALLRACGPLAATSANRSGEPPLGTRSELESVFGGIAAVILAIAPDAPAPSGTPSTVVDCTGPAVRVVREGTLRTQTVEEVVRAAEPLQGQ